MPIVDVEVVAGAGDTFAEGLAESLADAVGKALHSAPGQTWIRLRFLAHGHYAENGARPDPGYLPVFVVVLKRTIPLPPDLEDEIALLTTAVAEVVGRSGTSVHVEYAPAGTGRIAFGGAIVR